MNNEEGLVGKEVFFVLRYSVFGLPLPLTSQLPTPREEGSLFGIRTQRGVNPRRPKSAENLPGVISADSEQQGFR